MDCGPAALKSFLSWFGVEVGYDRLRELCQTDVDGTSIDTLEELANRFGIEVSQQMLPRDALVDTIEQLVPCLLVTRLGLAGIHFKVGWSKVAGWIQVLDPASGRRWLRPAQLSDEIYIHTHLVSGDDWQEIAQQGPLLPWLERRLRALGLGDRAVRLLDGGRDWRNLGAIDVAARLATWLQTKSPVSVGPGSVRLFEHCLSLAQHEIATGQRIIPESYWFARPSSRHPGAVQLRGAVLVAPTAEARLRDPQARKLPAALAGLRQKPSTLWSDLRPLLRSEDRPTLAMMVGALLLSACGTLTELMIFRASSTLVQRLGVTHQRLAAVAMFAVFLTTLLTLDYLATSTGQLMGRRLEGRLRLSLLHRLPRLPDSYFRSRLLSDMAQRGHQLHVLRTISAVIQALVRTCLDLLVTVLAIGLLQPELLGLTLLGVAASIGLPLLASRWLFESEDKVQSVQGSLSSFYLDALAGLTPLRTHGAEPALIGEHQRRLGNWITAVTQRQEVATWTVMLQLLSSAALSIALIWTYLRLGLSPQGLLLLLFWAQRIPSLGQAVVQQVSALAPIRTTLLRITEPLRTEVETPPERAQAPATDALPMGVSLRLQNVSVTAGGQRILSKVNLEIGAGEHVAIVGRSGAGKSSLLGLLLGIHRSNSGQIFVDDEQVPLPDLFQRLQSQITWVDPAVQLWNDSLLNNIQFGNQDRPQRPIAQVVSQAELLEVLDRLPEGFQTSLGDGGMMVSGGEGQRVRLARALLRRDTRLVLLDEPFRGLDRTKRRLLLDRVRSEWATATILCVTHDVAETESFDRVLVIEDGQILEDSTPAQLLHTASRYRQLHEADQRAASSVWGAQHWKRVRVQGGRVHDVGPEGT